MTGGLDRARDGGALWLTLNRPERRNAIDKALGIALLEAIDCAADDPAVRVVALTGAAPAFCAGDDIGSIEDSYGGDHATVPVVPGTRDMLYSRIIEAMLHCPKPIVAIVNGVSAGAGTEIACAADIRIAAQSARMGSALVRIGQVGNGVMLPKVVGPARAAEIFMTGRLVDADEALRIGLVHQVVPDEALLTSSHALIGQLAVSATKAIGWYKQLLLQSWPASPEFGLRLQDRMHRHTVGEINDAAEGIRAFVERRAPSFAGR